LLYGQALGTGNSVEAMDITVDRQHQAPARRRGRVPWSPRAWGEAVYLAAGIPVQIVAPGIVAGMVLWSLAIHSPKKAPYFLLIWLAGIALILLLTPVLTRVHRHRMRTTAGIDIPPQPKWRDLIAAQGIVAVLRSESTRRQLFYHLLIAPVLAAAAIIAVGIWPGSIATTVASAIAWSHHLGGAPPGDNEIKKGAAIALTFVGVIGLFIAPWLTSGVRVVDKRAARALLGPSRADELEYRVEQLTETRAGVVDAADAERRRLERDLHDGTQQRLVSLAINLGMARAQAGTADDAKQAIAEAHEEAKAALAELRDLIRGLHPAVLEDRGLDAALSGIAARMPIPVRLTVDLPRRPAPVVEAVAYFVVSEGLANIVKHAQATEAAIFVQRAGDRLHVIVTDDGVGGADAARGTGLAGLARRAASVDGTFEIDSPPGGPTLLTVDLPCNR
jgi:signal transduction histidine kinase